MSLRTFAESFCAKYFGKYMVKPLVVGKWLVTEPLPQEPFPPALHSFIVPFPSIKSFRNKDLLHQKYVVEGLSIAQIAAETFSSKKTVSKYLYASGMPLRGEKQIGQNNLRFGVLNSSLSLDQSLRELKTTEIILNYRASGFSIRKIAELLNAQNVPARKIGSRWYPKTVFTVLKNHSARQ